MLGTGVASYIIKRRSPGIEERLAQIEPSMVCASVITRAELLYGLKRVPPNHRLHIAVRRFLKIVRVFSWDSEALLDMLSAEKLTAVRSLLEVMAEPLSRSLALASTDDEEISPETGAVIDRARVSLDQGQGIPRGFCHPVKT